MCLIKKSFLLFRPLEKTFALIKLRTVSSIRVQLRTEKNAKNMADFCDVTHVVRRGVLVLSSSLLRHISVKYFSFQNFLREKFVLLFSISLNFLSSVEYRKKMSFKRKVMIGSVEY